MKQQKNPIFEAFFALAKIGGLFVYGIPALVLLNISYDVPWGPILEVLGVVLAFIIVVGLAHDLKKGLTWSVIIGMAPVYVALVQGGPLLEPFLTGAVLTAVLALIMVGVHYAAKHAKKAWLNFQLRQWMA